MQTQPQEFAEPVAPSKGVPVTYHYEQLHDPRKDIRLLYLHAPVEGRSTTPVRGSLIHFENEKAPEYVALSYTWGSEQATHSLSLCACSEHHGQESSCDTVGSLPITPNLDAALRRIASFPHHPRDRPIWVDAVCINQSDHNEKGHQVYKMNLIYEQAGLVYVWLGEQGEEGRFVYELVRLHSEICLKSGKPGHREFLEQTKDHESHWHAVSKILSHPWFRRRWIIQEAVLSRSKRFLWGDNGVCWCCFATIAEALQDHSPAFSHNLSRFRVNDDRYGMELLLNLNKIQGSVGSSRTLKQPKELSQTKASIAADREEPDNLAAPSDETISKDVDANLEALLEMFSTARVSDPLDTVYSLIALAPDVDSEDWIPDYSPENTPAAVYAKALQHITTINKDLDVLCRSAIFRPGSILPSVSGQQPLLPTLGCGSCAYCGHRNKSLTTFGSPVWLGITKVYRSSGNLPPYCDVSTTGFRCPPTSEPRLQVEVLGYRIGFVVEVKREQSDMLTLHTNLQVSKDALRMAKVRMDDQNCSRSKSTVGTSESISGAFWRSLVGNRSVGVGQAKYHHITKMPDRWEDLLRTAYNDAFDDNMSYRSHEADDLSLEKAEVVDSAHMYDEDSAEEETEHLEEEEDEKKEEDSDDESEDWDRIQGTATTLRQERKFALTESSMGYVPKAAQVGMPIYILHGCSVPVVLRQCPDCQELATYNLVGDCYIDGVMEGELADSLQEMEPEKITLH